MHDIDLNLLYTLDTFVRCGSLAETARALSRSQPAISARLHQLEEDLGVVLFERVGRRLVLTPVGRAVHREATVVVARAREVVDAAQSATDEPRGRLRIGTLGTLGVYLLAPAVAQLTERHPALTVELVQGLSTDLAGRLTAGELDFVASIGELPTDERLEIEVIREVRPVAVTRREDYPKPIRFDAKRLARHALLEWTLAEDVFFGRISRFLRDEGLADRVRVQVPHIATLKVLVRSGAGVAILPDYTVVDDDLVAHPMPAIPVMQPMWFAHRRAAATQPGLLAFRSLL